MRYKVVILTAGIGKRIGEFGKVFNKAMLPINGKPVICHLIDKFPEDVEIVIASGYKKEQVQHYLTTNYPTRHITFVDVDRWTGEGSGPGYSLLQCEKHLQCPFTFFSVDTIVTEKIPVPDHNWYGVAEVQDTMRFCSCKVDETKKVIRIDDKNKNDNKLAFIGLAGIHDYDLFWKALGSDSALIGGELQVSNGFLALMQKGMYAEKFHWFDTGLWEEYKATQAYFQKKKRKKTDHL